MLSVRIFRSCVVGHECFSNAELLNLCKKGALTKKCCLNIHIYTYVCVYIYVVHTISFQSFLWGMMSGVGRVRKSIHQSWLAKGLGLLCWGFKGVQEVIPSEEANTLQIGPVTFLPGQSTSPQRHPCHRLCDQDGHQDSSSPPPHYSPDLAPCDFCLFPKIRGCHYETVEEMKEAVTKVIDTLTQEDFYGAF